MPEFLFEYLPILIFIFIALALAVGMTLLSFVSLDNFLEVIKKSNETPVKKFKFPQTSAQEVGWNTEPLVSC